MYVYVLGFILLFTASACVSFVPGRQVKGSGNLASEDRPVSGVREVSLQGFGDMIITQADQESLTVEADDNLMEYIETRMQGDRLVIKMRDNISFSTDHDIRFLLAVKDLDKVQVSGSGNVESASLDVSSLDVVISGSGNVRVDDLKATDLSVKISGSGNFDLQGQVESQDIEISGSGDYRAGDLQSDKTNVRISGSGNVTVWVEELLDVHVSGQGRIRYYGQPKLTQDFSGQGDLESLGNHK